MKTPLAERTLALARSAGLLRPKDLDSHGIPRVYLRRLMERGLLERVGLGLYRIPGTAIDARKSLIEATRRTPGGILCLLSALQFHGLTTQAPFEVWIAVHSKAWRPRASSVPLRVVHLSGAAFDHGVESHTIERSTVRVYSAAKTVADCFKFRGQVGLDVAIEALRDYRRKKRGSVDAVWAAARTCRVTKVIKPYLEATA